MLRLLTLGLLLLAQAQGEPGGGGLIRGVLTDATGAVLPGGFIRVFQTPSNALVTRLRVEPDAEAIVKVVDAPFGERPFRVHIDPTQDGPMSRSVSLTGCGLRCCVAWGSTNCSRRSRTSVGFPFRQHPSFQLL
jgi:hypothetical protein